MVRPSFTIGLVQDHATADPAANLTRTEGLIRDAARGGAQVICLKELFNAPYFCKAEREDRFDIAEPVPGPTTTRMQALAKELAVVLIVPLFERQAAGVYRNSAAVIDADGRLLGTYRKMHIPDDPLYYEKYYFAPGDLGWRVFDTRHAKIGTLVCWDQWYPEAARLTAMHGAELIVYPTAIGWHPAEKAQYGTAQHQAWETMQRAHAISNGVYVAAVNRVGHEGPASGGLEFWGASFVSDPFGVLLARGDHAKEELVLAQCDRRRIEDVRRNWPFLRDRRIDAYGGLTRRLIDS